MSMSAAAIGAMSRLVAAIPDPEPAAPEELQSKTDTVLGMVMWGSLISVLGLLLAAGMISLAADRGMGGGMSPELKSSVMKGVVALVIVGSASAIVTFVAA